MKKYFTFLLFLALYTPTNAQCWKSIDGRLITTAVKNDGTLWGWGNNQFGQLGNGTVNTANFAPVQIGSDSDWSSVSVSERNTFGIKTDGTLWAWGNNWAGQMGIPDLAETNVPVQVGTDIDWLVVSAATSHTMAIKADGTLWAWGSNTYGQFGNSTYIPSNFPIQIGTSSSWSAVSAGHARTHAIKTDGTLWAWGSNDVGTLGDGTAVYSRNSPVQIGESQWQSVDNQSNDHVVAIKEDGSLWAWGKNSYGALGNGTNTNSNVPVQIGNDTWTHAAVGLEHSLAIKSDGTLWGWGKGDNGATGTGTLLNSNVPTQVGTDSDWSAIHAAFSSSMAVKSEGSLWVWGTNYSGELGVTSPVLQATPLVMPCPTALGLDTFKLNAIAITPNPSSFTIALHFSNEVVIDELIIYDALGKMIQRKRNNFEKIDIRNLQNGLYFVKVFSNDNCLNAKFIKN